MNSIWIILVFFCKFWAFKIILFPIAYLLVFFYLEINQPNLQNNINDISSFQNGFNDLYSSTGFYLKSKVIEGSHKGKNMFFNILALLFKIYIFEVVTFFSFVVVIQSTQFLVVVYIYKISVFDEAFFHLIIRMPMITKLFRVVTCCKELSLIYINDIFTVTNKIHISTCSECIDTALGKVVT